MKKRTKKWHCLFQYGALYLLLQFFLLAYLQVACQSENALQREPGVRVAITEQNAEALQVSLLQNTYRIPTQIQETTLPVPVFATEDGCLLYLFWKLLQSGRVWIHWHGILQLLNRLCISMIKAVQFAPIDEVGI